MIDNNILQRALRGLFESILGENHFQYKFEVSKDKAYCHAELFGVKYSFTSLQDSGNTRVVIEAETAGENLEDRLKENLLSNNKMDENSLFFADRKYELNASSIKISYRIKKRVEPGDRELMFRSEFWGYVLKPILKAVRESQQVWHKKCSWH
jgi:hypothetical protein